MNSPVPPTQPSLRRRLGDALFFGFGAPMAAGLIRILGVSLSFEIEGLDHYRAAMASERPVLFVFWHENLLNIALTSIYLGTGSLAVMISRSRDGEKLAAVTRRFGMESIRASSSRGAVRGMMEVHRYLINPSRHPAVVGLALDGPRGPRREAKPGAALIARRARAWIIPMSFEASAEWRLHSWDRSRILKPFARFRPIFHKPIDAAVSNQDDDALTRHIQSVLNREEPA